jgi:hypothetical protein
MSPVGRECFASLHKNILTFDGTETFHNFDQDFCSTSTQDEADLSSSQSSLERFIDIIAL